MYQVSEAIIAENLTENLIVGVYEKQNEFTDILNALDKQMNGELTALLQSDDIQKKYKKVSKIHTLGKTVVKRIYFIGLGKKEDTTLRSIKNAIGSVVKAINADNQEEIGVLLDTFASKQYSVSELSHSVTEAFELANYQFNDYKKKAGRSIKELTSVTLYSHNDKNEIEKGITTGIAFGKGTNSARTLVNIPGNLLTPTDLAEYAIEIAERYQFEYEVLEKEDMEKLGMGALLAVSKGSVEKPKLIVVKYQGKENWDNILSFVGKGLTFDAGGYSLKPGAGMEKMKSDMGGSAAVLGAMEAIGEIKPNVNLLFVIPSSENLVNGAAMKPGDVVTSLSGKTIEVTNTDAEGRLILADAITYAKEQGADYIVDLATLTGGVVVALGDVASGVITNHDPLFQQVSAAAEQAGELTWQLPNFKEYRDMLKNSNVADLNNSVGRLAHPITGGLFIGEFADETPWVHIDIAGTAYLDKDTDLGPKGATGVMVRTLTNLAMNFK